MKKPRAKIYGPALVLILIIIASVLIALFDLPAPYPKCEPNEVRVQSSIDWWCVPGRKQ